jgi:hypothetical protein
VFGSNSKKQLAINEQTEQLIPTKLNNLPKFTEISSHCFTNISIAKSVNNNCYVWGECEDSIIETPKQTQITSIDKAIVVFAKQKITFKPIFLFTPISSKRFIEKISNLFNNPEDSDIRFKFEEKVIYVHKCILKTSCDYFKSKFNENSRAMRESTDYQKVGNQIEVKEYSYDVYYAFLKYFYSNSVDIDIEKAIELLVLADNYGEKELKQKCFDIIKNGITIENVCTLYCTSIKHNLIHLESNCYEFCANNLNKICKTGAFDKMDENLLKRLLKRAADNQVFKH